MLRVLEVNNELDKQTSDKKKFIQSASVMPFLHWGGLGNVRFV